MNEEKMQKGEEGLKISIMIHAPKDDNYKILSFGAAARRRRRRKIRGRESERERDRRSMDNECS